MLIHGDCLVELKQLEDNSVDSCVTDGPYGLSFMGKKWDYDVPSVEIWKEVLRVLKPGGHLLSFSSSRTYHRMAVNIEDAGFEIRDQIMWLYGSGFPKSHNISKAIDKAAGAEREVIGKDPQAKRRNKNMKRHGIYSDHAKNADYLPTKPATPEAQQWDGWGTALKPSHEPIVLARKPLIGTVVENVLEHGTGAMNIDECRIATDENIELGRNNRAECSSNSYGKGLMGIDRTNLNQGRWPANAILDEEAGAMLDEQSGVSNSSDAVRHNKRETDKHTMAGKMHRAEGSETHGFKDSGGASRFFYCPKAGKAERNKDCENNHPTVKPVDLMRYLCRLVAPPGGIVLDPFMGSGTTGIAAKLEGFKFIGIEREEEYIEIARVRVESYLDYDLVGEVCDKNLEWL
jgi:DNA modification methylase